jgi:hypothetical protein
MRLSDFVKKYGVPYSEALGINLASRRNNELVKWFLASILYSKPIRESSATKTYKCFEKHGVITVDKILRTGWNGLVSILDEGGYTRYDFSTADKLLEVFGNLKKVYRGSLNSLYRRSTNSSDLEDRLRALGKGIGPTTISIFLRDVRNVWPKAKPAPSPLVYQAMLKLGIRDLEEFAQERNLDLVRLETALLRLFKDFIRKGQSIVIEDI